ncbi:MULTISPECIES: hypothetical protein [unclassified Rhodococcus (in: high G+C Gram-positive bacteria)]|uniref:hypothetical protein n=1 Tax=unclassified Rhodococcus (in: high G+C Gram-positive bacteria) TaxID=192944 RepID=UPI00163A8AFF|nr:MULTISPECIES: hypothetical protein [unclassified Rhodococcus (in: high G+C Gram-positive bacteria)]MBC2643076.1 hypothetical protein [Rhodococcus sp. 3A]MBC2892183.1 hypothetical protein [Rhodococcus sp. 4CII]
MSEDRRITRLLPVRRVLAAAGIAGLVAGGGMAAAAADPATPDSSVAAPLVSAGFGAPDALSSGS